MAAKIKPLGNRLLVRRAEPQTSKGGILLPESSKEKPKQGEVLAVGPGKYNEHGKRDTMQVKQGDQVLFGSYAGTAVSDQDDLLILSEDELLAIVN